MNYNIALLRVIAIISIVIHHSFCIYQDWPPNSAVEPNLSGFQMHISSALKLIGLSVFTFISGYLLYNQRLKLLPWSTMVKKKTQRILVPCLICGLIYWIMYPQYMYNDWPSCINGTHLWYLPMLFICVLLVSTLFYTRLGCVICVIGFLLSYVLWRMTNIRTCNEVFTYMPTFVLGYLCNKYELNINKLKSIICVWGG